MKAHGAERVGQAGLFGPHSPGVPFGPTRTGIGHGVLWGESVATGTRGQGTVMESPATHLGGSRTSGRHPLCPSCWSECAGPFPPASALVFG